MDGMDIVLWNQTPEDLEDSVGQLIADACDLQMREDVAPAYGWQRAPTVTFCRHTTKREELPGNCLVVMFAKDWEHAQTVTGLPPEALPVGGAMPAATTRVRDDGGRNFARVYPEIIRRNDGNISTDAHSISAATSHECIEATYDKNVALWVWNENDGKLVAGEVCDQVEDNAYTKRVRDQDVAVSNFVYPAWFDARAPAGSRFDHMQLLDAPFSCSEGGYFIFYGPPKPGDPAKPGNGFQIQTEPPGLAVQWGWGAKIKKEGFARTRVRLVWGPV
jgi:hypothetical protein